MTVWVPIGHCLYQETSIQDYQAAWDPARPLESLSKAEQNEALVTIALEIKEITASNSTDETVVTDLESQKQLLISQLDGVRRRKEQRVIEGKETTELDLETEALNWGMKALDLEMKRLKRAGRQPAKGKVLHHQRFRLIEQIGSGGFATVWKAYDRDPEWEKIVAIKILHGQYARDETRKSRFFRGAQKMAFSSRAASSRAASSLSGLGETEVSHGGGPGVPGENGEGKTVLGTEKYKEMPG